MRLIISLLVLLSIASATASRVHINKQRPAETVRSVDERWSLLRARMDANQNGQVEASEFHSFQEAHRAYDLNHDSKLDRRELLALSGIQHHELQNVVASATRNHTCAGKCGAWDSLVVGGQSLWCFCDSLCPQLGDCCTDMCQTCPSSICTTCPTRAPSVSSGCFPRGLTCTYSTGTFQCNERPLNPWELCGAAWAVGGGCTPACGTGFNCVNGQCVAIPDPCAGTTCQAASQCHDVGTCSVVGGVATCSNPQRTGAACDDNIAATVNDTCQVRNGAFGCFGDAVNLCASVVCPPAAVCFDTPVCNTQTGTCTSNRLPVGTTCNDNDATTTGDNCRTVNNVFGCFGNNPCTSVVCQPLTQCHSAGTCTVQGTAGVCSNPQLAEGTTCNDNNASTVNDACRTVNAVFGCVGQPAPNPCATAADGTVCNGNGKCHATVCVPLLTTANKNTVVNNVITPLLNRLEATEPRAGDTAGGFVRYCFHACGTWSATLRNGGCNFCLIHPCVNGQNCARADPDNAGLAPFSDILLNAYNQVTLDNTTATTSIKNWMSLPDFAVLTCNTVLSRTTNGQIVPEFRTGRTLCPTNQPNLGGRLPNPNMTNPQMDTYFRGLGFTTSKRQWYALLGAHSLGRLARSNSGGGRAWDTTPKVLDNNFWKTLANTATKWRPEIPVTGTQTDDIPSVLIQYEIYNTLTTRSTHTGTVMLRSDMEMGWFVNQASGTQGGPNVVLPTGNTRGCTVDHTTTATFCPPRTELTSIVEFWANDANAADFLTTFRASWNFLMTLTADTLNAAV